MSINFDVQHHHQDYKMINVIKHTKHLNKTLTLNGTLYNYLLTTYELKLKYNLLQQ